MAKTTKLSGRGRRNACYMAVTADQYELPVAVFDDIHTTCAWAGCSVNTMRSDISRGTVNKSRRCRFVAVKPDAKGDRDA